MPSRCNSSSIVVVVVVAVIMMVVETWIQKKKLREPKKREKESLSLSLSLKQPTPSAPPPPLFSPPPLPPNLNLKKRFQKRYTERNPDRETDRETKRIKIRLIMCFFIFSGAVTIEICLITVPRTTPKAIVVFMAQVVKDTSQPVASLCCVAMLQCTQHNTTHTPTHVRTPEPVVKGGCVAFAWHGIVYTRIQIPDPRSQVTDPG